MERATGAAPGIRRDHVADRPDLPRRLLEQLRDAPGKHREELRGQIVAEVGTPIGLTYAVQQDSCIDDMQYDIDLIDSYMWEERLGTHEFFGMARTGSCARTDRRRGTDHALELPVHAQPLEAGAALAADAGC